MKQGEYTVKTFDDARSQRVVRSGTFTAFKVVKVIAPNPRFLTCHLEVSDSMNYRYRGDNREDSLTVLTSNDTLYIKYVAKEGKNDANRSPGYSHVAVNVGLPAFSNLVVEGAEVVLDSPSSSGNLSVILKNNAVIRHGSRNSGQDGSKAAPAAGMKKEKVFQASKTSEIKSISRVNNKKPGITENAGEVDVDMKDLLVFRFL